jgi:hypothetical protein
VENPKPRTFSGMRLDRIGALAYTGQSWRLTYLGCGHEQLLAPFAPDQEEQAEQEALRHYASCRECRSTPPRPEPAQVLLSNWLYVRDADLADRKWHVVVDEGILPPCSDARCGLAPASRLGWHFVRTHRGGLKVHDDCLNR